MKIKELRIGNFRNIEEIHLFPGEGANIIYGDNAQGKTNLLEAVWLFTGSKSFRGARDSDYIRFCADSARVSMVFEAQGREQTASIAWERDKKQVRLNDIKQPRITGFSGVFCSVVFSPDHLSLIKQGPDKRRRMIDTSLCQAYPKYAKALEGYAKTLRQRNTLLRDIPHNSSLLDTLEVWDHNLIEYGSYITAMRLRYTRKLTEHAAGFYSGISSGREQFSMQYLPGIGKGCESGDREEIRSVMRERLRGIRREELRSGVSECGPHRDDVEITIDQKSARSFGSQGQQRSCILAIKLAECGILEERNLEPPVVMLDDVMSELDEHRRSYLLNQLQGKQVLITCCDARDFSTLERGSVTRIRGGALVEECGPPQATTQ